MGDLLEEMLQLAVVALLLSLLMLLLLVSLLLDLRRALVLGSLGRVPSLVAVVNALGMITKHCDWFQTVEHTTTHGQICMPP